MRYRLLNEPEQAESICLDILDVDPDNQEALVTLILALTDQFGVGEAPPSAAQVREYIARLTTSTSATTTPASSANGRPGPTCAGRWGARSRSTPSERRWSGSRRRPPSGPSRRRGTAAVERLRAHDPPSPISSRGRTNPSSQLE